MGIRGTYPFALGHTAANGQTISSTDQPGPNLEGCEVEVVDKGYSLTTARSHRWRKLRIVRNMASFNILGKRLVSLKAGANSTQVDGYARTTAQGFIYPSDEYLTVFTPNGVPQYDLFYIVLRGPAIISTGLGADVNNSIATDTVLVALTAVTSGAITAGRPAPQDLTGATANLGNQVQNAIGRALSALTTGQTNTDLLVDVIEKW